MIIITIIIILMIVILMMMNITILSIMIQTIAALLVSPTISLHYDSCVVWRDASHSIIVQLVDQVWILFLLYTSRLSITVFRSLFMILPVSVSDAFRRSMLVGRLASYCRFDSVAAPLRCGARRADVSCLRCSVLLCIIVIITSVTVAIDTGADISLQNGRGFIIHGAMGCLTDARRGVCAAAVLVISTSAPNPRGKNRHN